MNDCTIFAYAHRNRRASLREGCGGGCEAMRRLVWSANLVKRLGGVQYDGRALRREHVPFADLDANLGRKFQRRTT